MIYEYFVIYFFAQYDYNTLIKMMKNLLNLKNATLWNRIRYNTRSLATRLSIRVYFIYFLNDINTLLLHIAYKF